MDTTEVARQQAQQDHQNNQIHANTSSWGWNERTAYENEWNHQRKQQEEANKK